MDEGTVPSVVSSEAPYNGSNRPGGAMSSVGESGLASYGLSVILPAVAGILAVETFTVCRWRGHNSRVGDGTRINIISIQFQRSNSKLLKHIFQRKKTTFP